MSVRPVESLFGTTGAYEVDFAEDVATVFCRNSMDKTTSSFEVDLKAGNKILAWLTEGKPGLIQNVFPELNVDQREQMISGISPEDWNEWIGEE